MLCAKCAASQQGCYQPVPYTLTPALGRTGHHAHHGGAVSADRQARGVSGQPPGLPGRHEAAQRTRRYSALERGELVRRQIARRHLQLFISSLRLFYCHMQKSII